MWPECELKEPGIALDLEGGCIGGGCVHHDFAHLVELWGPPRCRRTIDYTDSTDAWEWDSLDCEWAQGIEANFSDDDQNLMPSGDEVVGGLTANEHYPGTSPRGLGVGISLRCFVYQLGPPGCDEIEVFDQANYLPCMYGVRVRWPGLTVEDCHQDSDEGVVDELRLY